MISHFFLHHLICWNFVHATIFTRIINLQCYQHFDSLLGILVKIFVTKISQWMDWFQTWWVALYRLGICFKQFWLLSTINFLFYGTEPFLTMWNDTENFCYKNLGSQWMDWFQIWWVTSYRWSICCRQ